MKKDAALPLLTLAAGMVGFLLRRVQWATGFEPDTGLAIPHAPAALALAVLSVAVAAVLLLLCRGGHRAFDGYDDAFLAPHPVPRTLTYAAALLLILAGAWRAQALLLTDWPAASLDAANARLLGQGTAGAWKALLSGLWLPAVCVVFCVASATALLLIARNNDRSEGRGRGFGALLIPAFGSCLWLILAYRDCSDDPVLAAYAYQLLAIIFITLALYQLTTFSFTGAGHPAATLVFSLLAVYFSLVTLADGHGVTVSLLFLAAVLFFTAQTFALLHNDARLPWPLRPAPEDGEADA
jgi:hypothetical protein